MHAARSESPLGAVVGALVRRVEGPLVAVPSDVDGADVADAEARTGVSVLPHPPMSPATMINVAYTLLRCMFVTVRRGGRLSAWNAGSCTSS